MTRATRLMAKDISVAFAKPAVLDELFVCIPDGKLTVIVGPNACGKSTLLRALARLQPVGTGQVILDGKSIHKQNSRSVARRLAILPQMPTAPEGLSVRDLVIRGRTPHQSALRQWSKDDAKAVALALEQTGMTQNACRPLEALSGGQRQRAWIAMALAQNTDILLLDEPTTYLDLPHQIELLTLVQNLNRETGRTVAMVLHDINLAARFADHVVALKNGRVHCEGSPTEVITEKTLGEVFSLPCSVIADPIHGTPHVIPA
ncbi:iron complex transport system ATP-binding protein [Ruegeria halocynthiae]|uniref:Iron complex transport system ATP-binding protein n=1 Tax=Ruegeria halocynthiae TaxID=985054 RepID=A0A1H2XXS3_9RHOB|nr:ABC transporter ATP-binding protein [Ruegeria halocynthiae]SDW97762.1 iron complex transport system ATP-binding protein [Ruegeria halocynthiae]